MICVADKCFEKTVDESPWMWKKKEKSRWDKRGLLQVKEGKEKRKQDRRDAASATVAARLIALQEPRPCLSTEGMDGQMDAWLCAILYRCCSVLFPDPVGTYLRSSRTKGPRGFSASHIPSSSSIDEDFAFRHSTSPLIDVSIPTPQTTREPSLYGKTPVEEIRLSRNCPWGRFLLGTRRNLLLTNHSNF